MPLHELSVRVSIASLWGQVPMTMRVEPRWRRRAESRLMLESLACLGGRATTTLITSAIAAVTASHWSPGCGTSTSRSRSIPKREAASTPNSGTPTTPHHEPAAEGPASSAMSNVADPVTE